MLQDLRYALRQLARSPGFTSVAVLSLALGIGATTAVLCWMRHLVLRPLPGVADPQQLVVVVSNQGGGNVSLPDLQDFVTQGGVFTGALASMTTPASLTVDNQPEWIGAQIISANAFGLLGVKPILGRTFLPDEDRQPGGNPVLVISERLWRRRFGGDPAVLGRVVDLNRHPFTIIGVVPAAFLGTMAPSIHDAWAPLSMIWEVRNQSTNFLTRRTARGWHNLARLQPGVTVARAHAAIQTVGARLAATSPDTNRDARHRVVPLSQCPWGAQAIVGPVVQLLLAVCAGVLLIVAANIANLLLARATGRQKEVAIRLAAGASRARLIRQLLTESVLLALAGGSLGVLFAAWAVDAIPLLLPEPALNLNLSFPLDGATLGLSLLLTLSTGIVFGLAPALQASRLDLHAVLKVGGRASTGDAAHHRLRSSLVVGEIALALVLLVGAGLCLQGLRQARRIDVGFNPDRVLLAGLQIGMNGYNPDTGRAFYRQVRARLAALPGVEEAALASWFPLGLAGCKGTGVQVSGYVRPRDENPTYEFAIVSPRYFAAMRIPLAAGREFTEQDDAAAPPVAIVNAAFARRFWPDQNPIGRQFRSDGKDRTVVGLVPTGKYNRLDEAASCFFYLPEQQGVPDLDLGICVRLAAARPDAGGTGADASAFANTLRQTVRSVDPGVELLRVRPLTMHVEGVFFAQRMASHLLLLLGAVALVLAAMGVYAVMAYTVGQRTREFGIRMALGATPHAVRWQVARQGLLLAGTGVAAGLVLAFGVTRLLSRFLYGVSPFDPLTFIGVPLLLVLIAVAACWLPARRATRVNPVEALRAE
jgi:predicted permease